MRSFLTYLLLFAIMLPTLSPWGTIAYFHLDRAYIAKVLCENRDKPQMKCDGKCYLAKKLKEQEEKKDKETTERIQNMPLAQLFIVPAFYFSFSDETILPLQSADFFYQMPVYDSAVNGILRPPQPLG